MSEQLQIRKQYSCPYPFCRTEYVWAPEDHGEQYIKKTTWRPGIELVNYGIDDFSSEADGMGEMLLTLVSIHRPGKYPTRVFYTRQWKDPDGQVWGKANLRMTTQGNFRCLLKGYRHKFELRL